MPRRIDLSTVSPERAAKLLQRREHKRQEYERRKETLTARNKEWRAANPEKERACREAWRATNQGRVAELKRASYERHREKRLADAHRRYEELADSVVRSRVARGDRSLGLTSADVPAEVLPFFRQTLLIRRELRKQKAES